MRKLLFISLLFLLGCSYTTVIVEQCSECKMEDHSIPPTLFLDEGWRHSQYPEVYPKTMFFPLITDSITISYDTPGDPIEVLVRGNLILVPDYDSLQILLHDKVGIEESNQTIPLITKFSVYPNPAKGKVTCYFHFKKAARINVSVYDELGRKIREIYHGPMIPGNVQFFWDGQDQNRNFVPAGAYFIKVFFRMIFLQRIHDNQCGFRAFKKESIKIFKNMRYTRMGFSTELLFKAAFNQLKIVETPVSANPRQYGTSHVNLIRILRSVSSCILYYILRKLEIDLNRSFLNKTLYYFYKKIKIKSMHNQKMTLQDRILNKPAANYFN